MAHVASWFGQAQAGQYGGTAARRVDWAADTIKVSFHTNAYTPDIDAHDFYDDLTNELATAGGYTNGGITLSGKTVTYDSASNETRLDASDISIASATFTFRKAVIRKDTGTAATSPLLGVVTFDADQSPANATFNIVWDATGVLKTTVV